MSTEFLEFTDVLFMLNDCLKRAAGSQLPIRATFKDGHLCVQPCEAPQLFSMARYPFLWNQQMFLQSELAAVLLSMAVHRCKASARLRKYKLLDRARGEERAQHYAYLLG